MIPYVEKLFIGKVKQLGDPHARDVMDRPWESGMFKEETTKKVWLSKTNLSGDEVADTKHHGGVEKAVFAYPMKHYNFWKEELDLATIGIGAMGENLAVKYTDEYMVCIGDTYELGDAVIQVSQPRQPCWKPARRFRRKDFALRIQQSGKTGWYFRVLKEGFVQGKQELKLMERPYPQWTVARANEVMHVKKDDLKLAEELATCPLLAKNWKETLSKRLVGETPSIDKRVYGPNKDD